MKLAYYKSKWTRAELNEKTVQFELRTYSGVNRGFGKFRIHIHGNLISVCICRDIPGMGHPSEDIHNLWNPELADKIQIHPDKSVADFLLVE
jgi:hypothetical protein